MALTKYPYLHGIRGCESFNKIHINLQKFTIGRGLDNSLVIPEIFLSRVHCKFQHAENEQWELINFSKYGTFLNNDLLETGKPHTLVEGDVIRLSPRNNEYIFRFTFDEDNEPPHKKAKTSQETEPATKQQDMQLALKLQDLEKKLKEQADEHLKVIQKMKEKEEEHQRDLEALKAQQEAEKNEILEKLQVELREKENSIRDSLEGEIKILQMEKQFIEANIKEELLKKEGESAESLKKMQEELEKVKIDLENTTGKKQLLEKELENVSTLKDQVTEITLQSKQDLLNNFGDLMESELQCSICNELFVKATTLNCMHTYCDYCIMQWRKKKNECAICRTKITSQNRSIALDNFIEKMVENLTQDMKNKRQEIIEERAVRESVPKPRRSRRTHPRGRSNSTAVSLVISSEEDDGDAPNDRYSDISTNSSDATSSSSSTSTTNGSDSQTSTTTESGRSYSRGSLSHVGLEWTDLSDEADEPPEPIIQGIRGVYYGGYGHCFRCGVRGHWANGCPLWNN